LAKFEAKFELLTLAGRCGAQSLKQPIRSTKLILVRPTERMRLPHSHADSPELQPLSQKWSGTQKDDSMGSDGMHQLEEIASGQRAPQRWVPIAPGCNPF
jgi:hypothetical protein